ncbi:hypothetical protein [Anaerofustis butyriciformans]|uniref:hypothetical protein n=1 Tax=Anaerofustis butyriciformans TaxID=3108533 RepID=UPI002E371441|nr:hypothetical protein [Anaerofustis sp. HA2171]
MSKITSFRFEETYNEKIQYIKKENKLSNNSDVLKFVIDFYIKNHEIKTDTEKIKKEVNNIKKICRNIEKNSYISTEMINNIILNNSYNDVILTKNLKSSIYSRAEDEYKNNVKKNVIITINKNKKNRNAT